MKRMISKFWKVIISSILISLLLLGLLYFESIHVHLNNNITWTTIAVLSLLLFMLSMVFYIHYITTQKLKTSLKNSFETEKALRESEERFRELAELLPQIVFELDLNGNLTYVNKHASSMLGYDAHEIKLGSNTLLFHSPEDRARITDGVKRTMQGEPIKNSEYTMLRKDGSTFHAIIYVNTILKAEKPVGIRGIVVDIDVVKHAEMIMRESEQRYRLLVETSNEGILVSQGGFLKWMNPMVLEMSGFSEEELLITPTIELIHPDDREIMTNNHKKRLAGEKLDLHYRIRLLKKDGSVRWVELSGVYLEWEGAPATLNFITDITLRKQSEDTLMESEANLAEAQQMAHVGSWELDVLTSKLKFTKEMYRIFDVHTYDFEGNFDILEKMIHPDDLDAFKCSIHPCYSSVNLGATEYRVIHRDGSVHNIFAVGKIHVDEQGNHTKSVGFAQNITDRKLAEESAKALDQMHQLHQFTDKAIEKERLAISRELHDDLGQALTAVRIDLEIMKQNVPDCTEMELLNKTSSLVSETIKTVQRLTSRLRPDIIDELGLEAAIEWYTKDFSQRYKLAVQLKIDSEIEVSPDTSLVIFRIMQESLTNIARHANASQVVVQLSIIKNQIHFDIIDNGIGIAENEVKSRISYGLLGMKERSLSLGGTFRIQQNKTGGTHIKVVIPIDNE